MSNSNNHGLNDKQSFQWDIPSDTSAGQVVQEEIIHLMEERSFSEKDVFGMRLALEEGIVNAIKHGNKMDKNKKVFISCLFDLEKVRVVIKDQGKGFNVDEVPDPTLDENLEKPSGRGVMLMKAFMSVIEYNQATNSLILERTRSKN